MHKTIFLTRNEQVVGSIPTIGSTGTLLPQAIAGFCFFREKPETLIWCQVPKRIKTVPN